MDLSDDATRATWCDYLGEILTGHRVILGIAPLAGIVDMVALLKAAGARTPLALVTSRGAGPVPPAGDVEVVTLDVGARDSMTEDLRRYDALARDLPTGAQAAIEEYDPEGEAFWLTGAFVANEPIDGRAVLGGRPRGWTALEDKLLADAIWDAVDTPHADHETVTCRPDALLAAAGRLDDGSGTVWSGDARDGFNGGGDFVRWVCDPDDADAAYAFFAPRCDQVRVMPFLEGVPCSIHGIVLAEGTAAFRPVELAILRRGRRFVYGGQGTAWSPPDRDRDEMRALVRRTGEHLRERHGYRGAFGIDGILTRDGFRPTELNARMSGGLTALARAVDARAFHLLQLNLVRDRDPRVSVDELESWALAEMDRHPFLRAIALTPARVSPDVFDIPTAWDGSRLSRGSATTGWLVSGASSSSGTYARLTVPDATVADHQRVAELNVALMGFLDAQVGTSFGEVVAAPDVRR